MKELEGDAAFAAYVAAGLPVKHSTSAEGGKLIITLTSTTPFKAYLTKEGQIQVFQSPHESSQQNI